MTRRLGSYREHRERLWVQQHGKCWWCERDCFFSPITDQAEEEAFTVDHIIPLSRFGTNHWRNLVGSCYSCNWNRDQQWRDIHVCWLRSPNLPAPTMTFSLAEKLGVLVGVQV